MNRGVDMAELRGGLGWDLLVVGGGIAGAGVALEAARSGARVALVEARDFGSGTSSRSSKLVHGGLRYLAQGQLGLTRESLHERNRLLREAGGLVRPLRFVLPVRAGQRPGRRTLGLGLAAYDWLAGTHARQWLAPAALQAQLPMLDGRGVQGAWSYVDAQADDARLVLRVLAEARRLGAHVVNHARVEALLRGPTERGGEAVIGARLMDSVSGVPLDVRARCVVNATGAWADTLRGSIGLPPVLRPLRGSHLLLPDWRLPVAQAVALFHPRDGRPVYALPWEGATLVGTTDLDHRDDLDREPGITRAEFDYLLEALQAAFPALGLGESDVRATWAGVRPVVGSGREVAPSEEPREHLVVDEHGLVTVTGGKLTTFRATAREALRLAARHAPALIAAAAVGQAEPVFAPVSAAVRAALGALPAPLRERWLARFGEAAPRVLRLAEAGECQPVAGTGIAWAELRWACRHEAVVHLDDLLLRRTRLGLLLPAGGVAWLPRLRALVQQELAWDDAQWQHECERYRTLVARCYGAPPRPAAA